MGYPSVTDRLHTRYSPVRRSSAVYCYTLLPLDLHVLSLSLAFILSQDQTLHSIKTVKKLFLTLSYWFPRIITRTRTCCFVTSIFHKNSCFLLQRTLTPKWRSESDGKDTLTNHTLQTFCQLFSNLFQKNFFNGTEPNVHPLKAGAKIKQLSITSKYFYHFF